MAPLKKMKTYGRSNKSVVNNSVDAVNILFAKNRMKTRHKKKKLLVKELPPRTRGQTLLADDSLHVSLEDTFDKIVKGNIYNVVPRKPQILEVNHSNGEASTSFKHANIHYSPIMTRRRRKSASLKDLSQTSHSNGTNKTDSIPHFKEPTVDKIDYSLEVEKAPKILPTSLSYIKLPEEVSNNLLNPDISTSRKEISYDPIFTNTFREKQMIHSSTPMVPTKYKEKIVNYTISPIKNATLPDEPATDIVRERVMDTPLMSTPIPKKSTSRKANNVKHNNDWKLQANLKVLLCPCPQDVTSSERGCEGFQTVDKIQSEAAHRQFYDIIRDTEKASFSNVSSVFEAENNNKNSDSSFITLRKRKITKSNRKRNKFKKVNEQNFEENWNIEASNESGTNPRDKNFTWSLEDFNSFVAKTNIKKNLTWSLADFESFSEKLINSKIKSLHSESKTNQSQTAYHSNESGSCKTQNNTHDSKSIMETPINFVTKRRRRLSDSCLMSCEKSKTPNSKFKTRSKRRLSLQEFNCLNNPDVVMKEVVIVLPKIDSDKKKHCNTTSSLQTTENGKLRDNCGNLTPFTSHENISTISSEVSDDSDVRNHFISQRLVINLTKLPLGPGSCGVENKTKNDESSVLDTSKSLFGQSHINMENLTNDSRLVNTQAIQIDSSTISSENYSDLSGNNEIPKTVTNKPIVSKYNLRKKKRRSFKKQQSLQINLDETSVNNGAINGTPHLSNKSIGVNAAAALEKSECDVAVSRNSNIQAQEFENFFINVTKRTSPEPKPDDKSKSTVNEGDPLNILENSDLGNNIADNSSIIIEETDREQVVQERNNVPHLSKENNNETDKVIKKNSSIPMVSENVTIKSMYKSDLCKNKSIVNEQQPLEKSERVLDIKTQEVEESLYPTSTIPNEKTGKDILNFVSVSSTTNLSAETIARETNQIKENSGINKVSSFIKFENFFTNAMKMSECSLSKLDDNKSILIEEGLQKLSKDSPVGDASGSFNPREFDEKSEKILPVRTSLEGTLIDLTASTHEHWPKKSSGKLKQTPHKKTNTSLERSVYDSSKENISLDVIESSIVEPDIIDVDGFRMPMCNNLRRRQSKTLLLKAGKLWRRSLSDYKRSSLVLSVMNEQPCIMKDGRYCICPKCMMSRESRCTASRRFSMKIVPAPPTINPACGLSILESYAHNTSYVSDQILEDNLENSIRSLSLSKRKTSIIQNSAPVTARELVLRRCGQTEPLPFGECYPGSILQNCQKIGEGVYGEVFLFRNPNGGTSVMKVIPIEGDLIVNGERQKKFEEIITEIVIAMELSNLRNKKQNTTGGFSETQKIQCVQGSYPEKLLYLWDLYDETRGSENDSPEIFGDDQLYIVLQLANGGQDLEAFIFNNSLQAYTMFQQVACALAVAEEELHFEHRDLHWGNILLSPVDKNKKINYRLNGKNYEIMTKGVEVAIIDFTLSRIECDGVIIFNDLSLDPDLFTAEGDYQFEIYKLMQKKNGNNWERFEPYSNILWLHYTLDKAITALRYKHAQTKIHKEYISKLKHLKNDILNYNSVKEFVLNNF